MAIKRTGIGSGNNPRSHRNRKKMVGEYKEIGFTPKQLLIIEAIANKEGKRFAEVVRDLVDEAFKSRGLLGEENEVS